jgi:hypothetical protein
MTDPLFTCICEFEGGTYVSQVRASNELEALKAWADLLGDSRPMGDRAERIADAALTEIEAPVPLHDLERVWCWTALIDDQLVLTNIVRSL